MQNQRFTFAVYFCGTLVILAASSPASSESCDPPCAEYEFSLELQSDTVFAANRPGATASVLQPSLGAEILVLPVKNLGVFASVSTEPVEDPPFGQNASFESIGAYVEEIYAIIEPGSVTLRAGKFNPIFSLASEVLPGINADELASSFDADERWGGEANVTFEGLGMAHTLLAAAFTTDRTILSQSLFTSRDRTRLSDGGAGNTNGLSSMSGVLSGCKGAEPYDCYVEGEFGYSIGVRYQKAGQRTKEDVADGFAPNDEIAYFAAATTNHEFEDLTLSLLAETAYLDHFEGAEDSALVFTGSAAVTSDQTSYIATYSQLTDSVPNAGNTSEYLLDVEAIYFSEEDNPFSSSYFEIGAAYTYSKDLDRDVNHTLSLSITLDFFGKL